MLGGKIGEVGAFLFQIYIKGNTLGLWRGGGGYFNGGAAVREWQAVECTQLLGEL